MNMQLNPRMSLSPRPDARNTRVLVVDDEEQNRTLLRDPLEAHGYAVSEATNGAEALRQVTQAPPDVILLDVMMPEMDGFEVCRRLKQDPATAPIPVLMVTALTDRKERLLGIKSGANDFLSKPVDLQDTLLRVGNAAHAKRLYDEVQYERTRSDALLFNMLPGPIAARMKTGESGIADLHADVTILVSDLVGFTKLAAHVEPAQVVELLDEVFSALDSVAEDMGIEKIKTIGDAYMVAAGLTSPTENHPEVMAEFALRATEVIGKLNNDYSTAIQIRTGISTGPVIAGVIGRRKFAYDVWGDTVNVAFGLESSAEPGAILVSGATFDRISQGYELQARHWSNVKGRPELDVYELIGRK